PRPPSGPEHLAVHPRQLALQPRLPLLRRHPRTLLRCLEQPRRPALDHHVHRPARLGTPVLISGIWYKRLMVGSFVLLFVVYFFVFSRYFRPPRQFGRAIRSR